MAAAPSGPGTRRLAVALPHADKPQQQSRVAALSFVSRLAHNGQPLLREKGGRCIVAFGPGQPPRTMEGPASCSAPICAPGPRQHAFQPGSSLVDRAMQEPVKGEGAHQTQTGLYRVVVGLAPGESRPQTGVLTV